jgi:hypothetical protein
MTVRRKKLAMNQAARKLYAIVEGAIAHLSPEEQAERWKRLSRRVAQIRKSRAKSSKP